MNRTTERKKPFYKINETGEKEPTLISSFQKLKSGHTSYIERPSIKGNVIKKGITEEDKQPLSLNKRSGIGNYSMLRQSFLQENVAGRIAIDFEKIEQMRTADEGTKIKLGDKTLKDLFQITTVDPMDKEWIAEYNRRIAARETKEQIELNPPFGRPQRPLQKMINLGEMTGEMTQQNNLNKDEVIKLIHQTALSAPNIPDVADIVAQLMLFVDDKNKINQLTTENTRLIAQSVQQLNVVSKDAATYLGADYHRFWSVEQLSDDLGRLMLFILSNYNDYTKDINKPVYSAPGNPISIRTLISQLSIKFKGTDDNKNDIDQHEKYFDLDNLAIVLRDYVVGEVNAGADKGLIDGKAAPVRQDGTLQWSLSKDIK